MPTPRGTLWPRDPHTAAKHRILAGYLDAWWPILLQVPKVQGASFLDGFAGPGEYAGGEEGSPLISIRSVLSRPELVAKGKEIRFIFIENKPAWLDHLRHLVEKKFPSVPSNVQILMERGEFAQKAHPLLEAANSWGSPIFANLDTWGIGQIPFSILQELAQNPSTEVMVTFLSDFHRRFASVRTKEMNVGDLQFNSTGWRRVSELESPVEKERFLIEEYRRTLRTAGFRCTMPFELSDEGGRTLYLVFGTNSERGVERMKDAMWRVDPIEGTSFRDPADPRQMALGFKDPNLAPLKRLIQESLKDRQRIMVDELKGLLFETMYRSPHVFAALRSLRQEGRINQQPEGRIVGKTWVWMP